MKKYELTTECKEIGNIRLFRVKALTSFGNAQAGELGGYIEKEDNLSQDGNALVRGNEDYTTIKGFGREYRNTTFFRQKNGSIGVVCGCFYGTLDEFRKKVRETHGESKYAKEYLMIADLMEMHFDRSEGE